jgi:gas vesicle protein
MENTIVDRKYDVHNTRNMLIGLVVGGLAGATAMLLLAPQSGRRTRALIQLRSSQLRDQTTGVMKNALAHARSDTREITAGVREKAGQLKHIGQDNLVRQLDHVSVALDAGKAAIKAA